MLVSSSAPIAGYVVPEGQGRAAIEFAIPREGGNSSAGEKHKFEEQAVRLSWWRSDGTFDPISSAELPSWGMMDVVTACARVRFFSRSEAARLIKALADSIESMEVDAACPADSANAVSAAEVVNR